MNLDPSVNLKSIENSLRDFISCILEEKLGKDWISQCGIAKERLEKWKNRMQEEKLRQKTEAIDKRLLYYSDFYDIQNIIVKNWDSVFVGIFSDKKTIEVFLSILEKYRDPDAHRRELFIYQKYLIAGISEEIKIKITKYHSKRETGLDCFPRINSIIDNFGNSYEPNGRYGLKMCPTDMILRPGDRLEFIVSATDPEGLEIEYGMFVHPGNNNYTTDLKICTNSITQKSNIFSHIITEENISQEFSVGISIKSSRGYHAHGDCDDSATFCYKVFPSIK